MSRDSCDAFASILPKLCEKDFILTKVLQLIGKVLTELRKQKMSMEKEPLAISMLEEIKWTLFVLKDREA